MMISAGDNSTTRKQKAMAHARKTNFWAIAREHYTWGRVGGNACHREKPAYVVQRVLAPCLATLCEGKKEE
jgi:hypothetical protein